MKTIQEIEEEYPWANVFTFDDFVRHVNNGYINSYDGVGYFHNGREETNIMVNINQLRMGTAKMRERYPYICWYNN